MVGLSWGRVTEVLLEDETNYILGVTVDNVCPMQVGTTYLVHFMVPGESPWSAQVVTNEGEQTELEFETPIAPGVTNLAIGNLFTFGGSIQVIVTDIKRKSNLEASVTVLDAAPAIHDADVGTIPEFVSNITVPPEWWTPQVIDIRSDGSVLVLDSDGTWNSRILVTINRLTALDQGVVSVECQYWPTGSDGSSVFLPPVPIDAGEVSILPVQDGTSYSFRLRYVRKGGSRGPWGDTETHTVEGKTAPPADVTGFTVSQVKETVYFSWVKVPDLDVRAGGYTIEIVGVGEDWLDPDEYPSAVLTNETKGTGFSTPLIAPGTWDFLIKARDTSGNYSENVARKTLRVVSFYETLYSENQAPLWSGTLTNLTRHRLYGYLFPADQNPAAGVSSDDEFAVFEHFAVNPYATMSYELEVDLGENISARAWGRIYSELGPGESGTVEPKLYFDYKEDGGAYGGYAEWTIGSFYGRYVKFKVEMSAADGLRKLTDVQFVVDKSY
jgi:hypothetical protein